jgi:hypothetical protein
MTLLVRCHVQKDKRITLGTVGHLTASCPKLGKTHEKLYTVEGEITRCIPVCSTCQAWLLAVREALRRKE